MTDTQNSAVKSPLHPGSAIRLFGTLFKRTALAMIASPARWGAKGWAAFSLLIISTAVAYVQKKPIECLFLGDGREPIQTVAGIGSLLGDGPTVAAVIITTLISGYLFKRSNAVEAGIVLAVAGALCGILTPLGQFVLAEARPLRGGAMAFFALDGHGISGHASSSAVLFWPLYSILCRELSKIKQYAVGAILMGWTTMVVWSRMWDGRHYLWNVMLGMALGFSIGYVAVSEWKKLRGVPLP